MIYGIKIFFKIYKYTAHIIIINNILLNAFNTIYYCMIRGITWSNAKLSVKNNIIFLKKRVNMLVNTFFKCVTYACNPFLLRNQSCRNFTFLIEAKWKLLFSSGHFCILALIQSISSISKSAVFLSNQTNGGSSSCPMASWILVSIVLLKVKDTV